VPEIEPPRIGLIVNPVAGIGGRLAVRGSDLFGSLENACAQGGTPVAQERTARALRRLRQIAGDVVLLTASGAMGADVAGQCGYEPQAVKQSSETTTASDTMDAARALMEHGIDLLLFAGGDGTARDIVSVVGDTVAMIGIPTGVKMQSAVFALTPEAAGEAAARALLRPGGTRLAEIMDADQAALAAGRPSARLYGYAATPAVPVLLQAAKGARPEGGEVAIAALGRVLARDMPSERLVVLGPGTTMQMVKRGFGFEGSLLGVDAVAGGKVIALDADAERLEAFCEGFPAVSLLVGVIGNQGFVFGRGNQQISPDVIRKAGRDIRIIATREKLLGLATAVVVGEASPSALPGISPTRREIESPQPACPNATSRMRQGASPQPLSPLEGEMPGRAEGGIAGTRGATPALHADTGDPALDASLAGYHRVLTGPNDVMVMRLAAAI
jgi:predicted polyphosphate/ATP-dependent NAD kinase